VTANDLGLVPVIAELLPRTTLPQAGEPAHCAVSGGADSLALMVLATAKGCRVTAFHVDHGLRPASAAEAELVAETAERFGSGFVLRRVEVPSGPNLEARARALRYGALPADVMTGHTADDQAETVLMNLIRGAGLPGVSGVGDRVRRPLLALRREDTEAACRALGLRPVQDPMNADPAYVRARIRTELLPLLCQIAGRDVVPLLNRHAAHARDAVVLLDSLALTLDPTDARSLARADPTVARLALRRWLQSEAGAEHPPDLATVDRVLAVARGEAVATEINGGLRVSRRAQRLSVQPPGARQ
jgi:tRNA(Ile)-lysidine synthase